MTADSPLRGDESVMLKQMMLALTWHWKWHCRWDHGGGRDSWGTAPDDPKNPASLLLVLAEPLTRVHHGILVAEAGATNP